MSPPRTPWLDFPDVFIHASESAVKRHPHYRAAKSGDAQAAAALVAATSSHAQTQPSRLTSADSFSNTAPYGG